MAKKFISFLGTGKYEKCNYLLNATQRSEAVRFVQEALIRLCCTDFTDKDTICILLTEKAKIEHWETKTETGLQDIIGTITKTMQYPPKVKPVDINDGKNEEEIWSIFNTVYELLEEGDEIIFDITHGFRSLPLLFFAVLNYARYLRHISVKAIYYGAWEARDTATNVAPIFDLTPFYTLMQWGNAADAFVNYGHTDKLNALVSATAAQHIGSKKAGNSVHYTFNDLSTVRGKEITEGKNFTSCVDCFNELERNKCFSAHEAFKPFFSQIKSKFSKFKENTPENFLFAAQLHLKHGREQQAITLLQEGLLTLLIHRQDGDWQDKAIREICARCINEKIKEKQKQAASNPLYPENEEGHQIGKKIQADALLKAIIDCDIYHNLTLLRNDINHGGYNRDSLSSRTLSKSAEKYCKVIEQLISEHIPERLESN